MPTFNQSFAANGAVPANLGGVLVNDSDAAGLYIENRLPVSIRLAPMDSGPASGTVIAPGSGGVFGGYTVPAFHWAAVPLLRGKDVVWSAVVAPATVSYGNTVFAAGQTIARQSNYYFTDITSVTYDSLLATPVDIVFTISKGLTFGTPGGTAISTGYQAWGGLRSGAVSAASQPGGNLYPLAP